MDGFYHSPLFDHIRKYFENGSENETLYLFVPYIKTEVLEELLDGLPNKKIVVVTTWKPQDIQFGSSDLSLYPFCQKRNIALYVSKNLHLKVYSIGLINAILATGNISHRGLFARGNYEAAMKNEDLTIEDRLFFEKIRREARLVDNTMYEELNKWSKENLIKQHELPDFEDIVSVPKEDDFSASALPMTRSVDDLVLGYERILAGHVPSDDSEISACILHDLVNYNIPTGLNEEDLRKELSANFFAHPFIQKIDEFIDPEAYFGGIKEWIQNNCTDVPVPSRRELTGNVQVLLEWFERLGNGKYIIDIPGSRSQRIKKLHS